MRCAVLAYMKKHGTYLNGLRISKDVQLNGGKYQKHIDVIVLVYFIIKVCLISAASIRVHAYRGYDRASVHRIRDLREKRALFARWIWSSRRVVLSTCA